MSHSWLRQPHLFALAAIALALASSQQAQAQLSFTYQSFDPPGVINPPAAVSEAYGISNTGAVVGVVGDSTGTTIHGYQLQNGVYTQIDYPGAAVGGQTWLNSINSAGVISGYYVALGGNTTGFLDNNGVFSSPTVAGAAVTSLKYINDAGLVGTPTLIPRTSATQPSITASPTPSPLCPTRAVTARRP